MKILAVDSSAKACSVSLVDEDKILGEFFINTSLTHSQTLVPMIDAVLKNTSTDIKSVDAFAVSAGPGSFTGVRIGVAAIKGMAMPLDKPCYSVSTLEAMAYNLRGENCVACAVMDARCNQVYNALFLIKNGKITRLCDDRALSIDELAEDLKSYNVKTVLVGDGAQLCYNSYKELSCDIELAPEQQRYQRASGVAFAALTKEPMTAESLMPTYLRLPQAERELKKRLESQK
ncbi:MAG: tRNA (adenosine(37)-N6)-threonylcarbamoyltransferase complex dimerization subunit type 1 TsaB [Ruminococcus sp.]|nr:tRNA (adenosine(37)-N6)-threonylcarbamoyltransferase complex dimerization subunit type 1 TsaB [Ruminococcus sp.]